jgi:hypothetical protein
MKFCLVAILLGCLAANAIAARTSLSSSQQIFKTPDETAQTLYNAWRTKNRFKAQAAATNEAIEKLFGVKRRVMKFKGCHKREEGDFECLYEDQKNDFQMAMLVEVSRRGYRIKSVSFSSEAQ